jgi:hypothetical protein
MRRFLIAAIKTVENGGDPPGVSPVYYKIRAIEKLLPNGVQWLDALRDEIYPT